MVSLNTISYRGVYPRTMTFFRVGVGGCFYNEIFAVLGGLGGEARSRVIISEHGNYEICNSNQ